VRQGQKTACFSSSPLILTNYYLPADRALQPNQMRKYANMEAIGIIGMIFGLSAFYRVYKLEKVLKESGVLDKNFDINK